MSGASVAPAIVSSEFSTSVLRQAAAGEPWSGPTERFIVRFVEPPVARFQTFAGSHPENANPSGLDLNDSAVRRYRERLLASQNNRIRRIAARIGRPPAVAYRYTVATNGVALDLTAVEADLVRALPGVEQIQPEIWHAPLTDAGPGWIGAPAIWSGLAIDGVPGTMGEGIIIGVLDTGINMDHPSFAAVGGDGHNHTNPFGSGNYVGFCASDPVNFTCNDKLIGAWSWPESDNNPEGTSHGSHVAAIAAGNVVTLPYMAPTVTLTPTLSGVAPHANLIAYDVCKGGSGCPESVILQAIDQALLDGVDVINYSIGGPATDPWRDSVALAFLAAREAGVFVAVAAGNGGPGEGTILSPANAPWVTAVGNSTYDAYFGNVLLNLSGGLTSPPMLDTGSSVTGGYGPAPIVYAAHYINTDEVLDDGRCAVGFPPGTWTAGEIVFCDHGGASRSAKAQSLQSAGAGGIVVASNWDTFQLQGMERYVLPGLNLRLSDGNALRNWLDDGGTGHLATIRGTLREQSAVYADTIYRSSARGPNSPVGDVLKPDVVAPGNRIWSATRTVDPADPPELGFFIGTSQASPHVAGAAALLLAIHPAWTPAEIESALMTTALTTTRQEDETTPAHPFDTGAGRVQVARAAAAGLLLDEPAGQFRTADPRLGGDPAALNLASFAEDRCVASCLWTRRVRNPLSQTTAWTAAITAPVSLTLTITPTAFALAPGATRLVTITADVESLTPGIWEFAQIGFVEATDLAPPARLPLAVASAESNFPPALEVNTRRDAGSLAVPGLKATGVTSLTVDTFEMVWAEQTEAFLNEDPFHDDPYDNLADVLVITRTVQPGDRLLLAELVASAAPDLDLYVGRDGNGDQLPAASEELCHGITPSWREICSLSEPAPGIYWILVQSWRGSPAAPDALTLSSAVVPGVISSNSEVTGPLGTTVPDPFTLHFEWDEGTLAAGERWLSLFEVYTDTGAIEPLAAIPVSLVRHDDDVVLVGSATTATAWLRLTYTMTVRPNVTPHDLTYSTTITLPDGLQVISGTVSNGATVHGDEIQWSGVLPALGFETAVVMFDATVDSAACGEQLTLTVAHETDNPASQIEVNTADLDVVCRWRYLPLSRRP